MAVPEPPLTRTVAVLTASPSRGLGAVPDSQRRVLWPEPGNFLEGQVLQPHPRPTESEAVGRGLAVCSCSPPGALMLPGRKDHTPEHGAPEVGSRAAGPGRQRTRV